MPDPTVTSYCCLIDYGDDEPGLFGPFATNDAAMKFGQQVLRDADEDDIINGFTSLRLEPPHGLG